MLTRKVCFISLFLIIATPTAFATNPAVEKTSGAAAAGFERFIDSCAFCHGVDAKGNGDAAGMLSKQPANLTQLSKRNKNVFPLEYVYDTIDGRNNKESHGLREMPVWGDLWTKSVPPEYAESYVRARIFEIILYLYSVQE